MKINKNITVKELEPALEKFFEIAAAKTADLLNNYDPASGTPVFTVEGKYTSRGWTEWTQGFMFGMPILIFDAVGDTALLEAGRSNTVKYMAPHLTHFGVHDHGFNNVSTYGNLLRLMSEGKIPDNEKERDFYELALKCSGAVQARRWTDLSASASVKTPDSIKAGYIYSFNGPHSLFVDTMRSLRSLAVSHKLGHAILDEGDKRISLLERLVAHTLTTSQFSVYYGEGRDSYDIRGRAAQESIFNLNDGNYRCPSTQQGYSPFTTWTRGLSWVVLGFAEELEFLDTLSDEELARVGGKDWIREFMLKTAQAVSDFYIENSAADGVPYWDTGAPGLSKLENYLDVPSDPYNNYEPVDGSAAAITAQGMLRLGRYLEKNNIDGADKYRQAGLTIAGTILAEPYLSTDPSHQGLLLHSVYHRPNGWDHVPKGQKVPCGESSMWGDYHAMETALCLLKELRGEPYYTFFNGL